jgi:hypothetical protein
MNSVEQTSLETMPLARLVKMPALHTIKILSRVFTRTHYSKNAVFRDIMTPCCSCKNRRFGGTYRILNCYRRENIKSTIHYLSTFRWIHFTSSHPTYLRCILTLLFHLCLGLSSNVFHNIFGGTSLASVLHVPPSPSSLITLPLSDEKYRQWNPSLCRILQLSVIPPPRTYIQIVFPAPRSQTPSLCPLY